MDGWFKGYDERPPGSGAELLVACVVVWALLVFAKAML